MSQFKRLRDFHRERPNVIRAIEDALINFLNDVERTYSRNVDVLKNHLKNFLKIFRPQLILHFKAEETGIFPHLSQQDRKIIEKEHVKMLRIMDKLETMDIERKAEDALNLIKELNKLLNKHVAMENKIFDELERILSNENLEEINRKIEKVYGLK